MNDEMALLALINDRKEFKNKDFINFIFDLESIEHFFLQPPDWGDIWLNQKNKKNHNKINSLLELQSKINFKAFKSEIIRIENSGVNLIPYCDGNYPKKLKEISDPPFLLYHKGEVMNFDNCVAIVGTRNLSYYGHRRTREISRTIAENGYTIVSGLARGTDTEAHCGALDAGGKTLAILAGHIEDIFPKENQKLAFDILNSGAILSEISTLEKTHKGRFIERNRLTSGISECVIVIESEGTGGTLHQVNLAIGQGRKVFIMKPLDTDELAIKGFKEFIKLGAIPFDSLDPIFEFLKQNSKKNNILTLENFT